MMRKEKEGRWKGTTRVARGRGKKRSFSVSHFLYMPPPLRRFFRRFAQTGNVPSSSSSSSSSASLLQTFFTPYFSYHPLFPIKESNQPLSTWWQRGKEACNISHPLLFTFECAAGEKNVRDLWYCERGGRTSWLPARLAGRKPLVGNSSYVHTRAIELISWRQAEKTRAGNEWEQPEE
jgi:hypothetical protein